MTTSGQVRGYDQGLLERLNRASLARSFIPQVDIDWDQTTTDAEYESLYSSWSLLEGSDLNGLLYQETVPGTGLSTYCQE